MALCTTVNPMLTKTLSQYYPHSSIHDIETTLKQVLDIHFSNRTQLVRSFSVEGTITPNVHTNRIYNRTTSLFIHQILFKSPYENLKKEFSLISTEKQFDFQAIPEEETNTKRYYSTKKAYDYPLNGHKLSSPPNGYKPICIQLLARHGSRSLNSHDYDIQTLKIWQVAKERHMLTPLGEQLKDDTELFMKANNHVGRGELTEVGKQEHFNLGKRLHNRLKCLFDSPNKISILTSGKKRAIDSSKEFLNGLINCQSNIEIANECSNKNLLYFHKSSADYMQFKKTNQCIKTKLDLIKYSLQTKKYAEQVLKRIYKTEFVHLLINENYDIFQLNEHDPIKNEIDVVFSLYLMFAVAPAQIEAKLANMLTKYFNQEESNWFAYINDAQEYYLKGPSIEGTTVTYDMAKPLLADFFSSISGCTEKTDNISAHLRFAHAETIIPFATLLQIPNFSDQATNPSDTYTYENSQWRGDKIAPMAANIQWEVYQHENNSSEIIVRMLYNETEIKFKQDCEPLTPDSYFYDLNELKRSYANVL